MDDWRKDKNTSGRTLPHMNICGQGWECREWIESTWDLNRERPQRWTTVGSVRFLLNLLNFVPSIFNTWIEKPLKHYVEIRWLDLYLGQEKSQWLQCEELESVTDGIKAGQLGGSMQHSKLKDDLAWS